MIESMNRVLETQKQLRAPVPPPPAEPSSQPANESTAPESDRSFKLFGKDGFNFFDLLDVINPLQHIPVVSTIYRRLTGDELSPAARVAGATLFGGPIGTVLALADSAVEYKTGMDTGANLYAALFGDQGPIPAAGTAVAAAPWQDPDLVPLVQTATSSGGKANTYLAAAAPDLGALADLPQTGAHATVQTAVLRATPAGTAPAVSKLDDAALWPAPGFVAAAWKDPDLVPMPLAATAQANRNDATIRGNLFAPLPDLAQQAARVAEARQATTPARAATADAQPPANAAIVEQAERPMPSDAAKAQAINALAAMPTSQTAAAVAELARNEPRSPARAPLVPPAGDIPRGAASSLARSHTRAYANSTASAKPTLDEVKKAADAYNANAIAQLEQANGARNDWMLDAMQNAMAKYEAVAKLRNPANGNSGAKVDIAVGQ